MTNNRANGVLMPVINGEIGPTTGRFQQRQLRKINFSGLWLLDVVFAGDAVSFHDCC
jgi:hypothetical protein